MMRGRTLAEAADNLPMNPTNHQPCIPKHLLYEALYLYLYLHLYLHLYMYLYLYLYLY